MPSKMEAILGASFGHLVIPGTTDIAGAEILYYSENGRDTAERLFSAITRYTDPPNAQSGGASPYGCELTLPDGSIFHAVGFMATLTVGVRISSQRTCPACLARSLAIERCIRWTRVSFMDCKARFY
jgi:hypothetical protein